MVLTVSTRAELGEYRNKTYHRSTNLPTEETSDSWFCSVSHSSMHTFTDFACHTYQQNILEMFCVLFLFSFVALATRGATLLVSSPVEWTATAQLENRYLLNSHSSTNQEQWYPYLIAYVQGGDELALTCIWEQLGLMSCGTYASLLGWELTDWPCH